MLSSFVLGFMFKKIKFSRHLLLSKTVLFSFKYSYLFNYNKINAMYCTGRVVSEYHT